MFSARCLAAVAVLVLPACSDSVANDDDDDDVGWFGEVVDRAGDFVGDLEGGRIGPRGTIEPWTYARYGLRARGYHAQLVTSTTTSADLTDALVGPAQGARYRFVPGSFGDDWPRGLGLGRGDDITIIVDGELELPAGEVVLELIADDLGFIELDIDGSVTTLRSAGGVPSAMTIEIAHDGWYPIVGAMSDASGAARFELRRDRVAVAASALRYETTEDHGLELLAAPVAALDRGVPTVVVALAGEPLGRGPNDVDLDPPYFASYQGYLRLEETGPYTVDLDLDLGADVAYRITIDYGYLAATYRWPGLPDATYSLPLAPGWHQIELELADAVPESRPRLVVTAADHPVTVEPSSLRPLGYKSERAYLGGVRATWIDGEEVTLPITLQQPVVTSDSSPWDLVFSASLLGNDVTMTLTDPEGVVIELGAQTSATLGARSSLAGTWTLHVVDAGTDGWPGELSAGIDATHPNAVDGLPLTSKVTYTSPPRPTPGARVFIALDLEKIDDLGASVAVRSAYTVENLQDAVWHTVDGSDTPIGLSEWTQYRFTSSPDWYVSLFEITAVSLKYAAGR